LSGKVEGTGREGEWNGGVVNWMQAVEVGLPAVVRFDWTALGFLAHLGSISD